MKNKKTIIEIPDDLTPDEEVFAIAKALSLKQIGGNDQKKIGSGYDLKYLETTIVIKRTTKEKIKETKTCSCCNCVFVLDEGSKMFTNYGGKKNELIYCSDTCRDIVLSIVGDRGSVNKRKLKPLRFY